MHINLLNRGSIIFDTVNQNSYYVILSGGFVRYGNVVVDTEMLLEFPQRGILFNKFSVKNIKITKATFPTNVRTYDGKLDAIHHDFINSGSRFFTSFFH